MNFSFLFNSLATLQNNATNTFDTLEAFIQIIILGIVQGVAEFLPISSDGHLALVNLIYPMQNSDTVTMIVTLHAGSLLAIIVYYRETLKSLLSKGGIPLLILGFVAMIPTGIIGLFFHFTKLDNILFSHPSAVGIGFLITGSVLWYGLHRGKEHQNPYDMGKASKKSAIAIGCAQGLAILPGVSRSGSTIATATALGMKKEDAATFSFLIAIPAIAGATGVKLLSAIWKQIKNQPVEKWTETLFNQCTSVQGFDVFILIIGFIISAVVGYFVLRFLNNMLRRGKFQYFAYYCLLLGFIVLFLWSIGILNKVPSSPENKPSETSLKSTMDPSYE